jgi:hypothetical protein
MKERVLSHEKVKSSKGGLTSTKKALIREQFQEAMLGESLREPGRTICLCLIGILARLDILKDEPSVGRMCYEMVGPLGG